MGFNCFKPRAISRRQFTFYHQVPRYSWYSFYRPRKDERPSRPWSHPVVLNTGTLDLESSALTNRPLQTLSSRLVASNDHSYIVNTTYFESIEATSKHGKAIKFFHSRSTKANIEFIVKFIEKLLQGVLNHRNHLKNYHSTIKEFYNPKQNV